MATPPVTEKSLSTVTRDDTGWLLARWQETEDPRYGDALVRLHRGLVISRVNRYANRHAERADLEQVALMALWKAVRRFDPVHEVRFSTYATRTIDGEIKRYFRDHTWGVHVPRGLKERSLKATRTRNRLTRELDRAPTLAELAEAMDDDLDAVAEALDVADSYTPSSLDAPIGGDEDARALHEQLPATGAIADHQGRTDDMVAVTRAIKTLPEREQKIIALRFFGDYTQSEIAERVGCSQMHVSRLLRRAIKKVRAQVTNLDLPDMD